METAEHFIGLASVIILGLLGVEIMLLLFAFGLKFFKVLPSISVTLADCFAAPIVRAGYACDWTFFVV